MAGRLDGFRSRDHDPAMSSHRFGRREALRLGVIGTAVAMGRQVLVAPAQAHDAKAGPLWKMAVEIQGLKALSANVCSIAIDPLDLDVKAPGKELDVRAIIRANGTPQVRKEIQAWFAGAHSRNAPPPRSVEIVLVHRDGGSRTYSLQDVFPVRFSAGDYTTGAETCLAELEVQATRVELA